MTLLDVRNLNVCFGLKSGVMQALYDVSFTLERGERVALVGESGAGKSILGFSIVNLISKPGFIESGSIKLDGKEVTQLSHR